MEQVFPKKFQRFLAPSALLWGVASSFLLCCVLGRIASHHNYLRNVERFHKFLSPETLFYPTPAQLREWGRANLDPKKIAVIVAGSSRLHGTGQTPTQIWTRKLQHALGDDYQVLNLGFRCAFSWDMGAVAGEILSSYYPRMIVVTDCVPGGICDRPDGRPYEYFFWEAYYHDLLLPDPAREARLHELEVEVVKEDKAAAKPAGRYQQLKSRAIIDSYCYFDDLWNNVAYRLVCTTWTPPTRKSPFRRRSLYADPEREPYPLEERYPAFLDAQILRQLRAYLPNGCVKDRNGRWTEDSASGTWFAIRKYAATGYPSALHEQTLILVMHWSPHYEAMLSADEQDCLRQVCESTVRTLEEVHYSAMPLGAGYTPADYADNVHLTESGGAKMAAEVAVKIRQMARRLEFEK
jgi:hypothetical protein